MTTPSRRSPKRRPTHPGAFLRDVILPAMPITKAEFARTLGISRQSLYEILAEKQPVTPVMAVRLGIAFGHNAASWLNMQSAYDLWRAERAIDRSTITRLGPAS